jgi:hypothetical protein
VVLDSRPDFQLKLRALGVEIVQMGMQLIFLIAILLLQDEEDFFQAICIPIAQQPIEIFDIKSIKSKEIEL